MQTIQFQHAGSGQGDADLGDGGGEPRAGILGPALFQSPKLGEGGPQVALFVQPGPLLPGTHPLEDAGAGTLVPITGFANAMVSPALEFKTEGLVAGTAAKLFTVAGPVLVFGISASVVYGVVYFLLL